MQSFSRESHGRQSSGVPKIRLVRDGTETRFNSLSSRVWVCFRHHRILGGAMSGCGVVSGPREIPEFVVWQLPPRARVLSRIATTCLLVLTASSAIAQTPRRMLDLWTSPAGATITIDGSVVGRTPTVISVPVGRRQLVVEREGFARVERTLDLEAGPRMPIRLELVRLGSSTVTVRFPRGVPSGLQVSVDGTALPDSNVVRTNSLIRVEVHPGRRILELRSNGAAGWLAIDVPEVASRLTYELGAFVAGMPSGRPAAGSSDTSRPQANAPQPRHAEPVPTPTYSTSASQPATAPAQCSTVCMPHQTRDASTGCCIEMPLPGSSGVDVIGCERGQSRRPETSGLCCFDGQVGIEGRCRGVPSACPLTHQIDAPNETCTVIPCMHGRTRASDGLACCWPGQVVSGGACRGFPNCPHGWVAENEECVSGDEIRARALREARRQRVRTVVLRAPEWDSLSVDDRIVCNRQTRLVREEEEGDESAGSLTCRISLSPGTYTLSAQHESDTASRTLVVGGSDAHRPPLEVSLSEPAYSTNHRSLFGLHVVGLLSLVGGAFPFSFGLADYVFDEGGEGMLWGGLGAMVAGVILAIVGARVEWETRELSYTASTEGGDGEVGSP